MSEGTPRPIPPGTLFWSAGEDGPRILLEQGGALVVYLDPWSPPVALAREDGGTWVSSHGGDASTILQVLSRALRAERTEHAKSVAVLERAARALLGNAQPEVRKVLGLAQAAADAACIVASNSWPPSRSTFRLAFRHAIRAAVGVDLEDDDGKGADPLVAKIQPEATAFEDALEGFEPKAGPDGYRREAFETDGEHQHQVRVDAFAAGWTARARATGWGRIPDRDPDSASELTVAEALQAFADTADTPELMGGHLRARFERTLRELVAKREGRCRFDTDNDGNCHVHPKGCPKGGELQS